MNHEKMPAGHQRSGKKNLPLRLMIYLFGETAFRTLRARTKYFSERLEPPVYSISQEAVSFLLKGFRDSW